LQLRGDTTHKQTMDMTAQSRQLSLCA